MKIYIASAYKFKSQCEKLASWLLLRAHKITCEWWHIDFKNHFKDVTDKQWYSEPIIRVISQRSFKAIEECDVVIVVAPSMHKFTGASVEIGYALAKNKLVIAFGDLERSPMFEPLIRVRYKDWNSLYTVLEELGK